MPNSLTRSPATTRCSPTPRPTTKSWARGLKAAGYATAPDYAQRLCRIIEEAQLFLLDQPDGERLYASRSGRKITDPEGWFTDQTSMERPADASSASIRTTTA